LPSDTARRSCRCSRRAIAERERNPNPVHSGAARPMWTGDHDGDQRDRPVCHSPKLDELLPWNWIKPEHQAAAA
jgi:hypothetical protein